MKKSAQTVIRPDACYTIAAANGRVLEVADFNTENGASVRLWSYEGQPWQQWFFVEAGENEYRIKNRFTGKVMDLALSGVENGTWVHQWSATSGAGQRWQIVDAGGGKVKLRNVLADNPSRPVPPPRRPPPRPPAPKPAKRPPARAHDAGVRISNALLALSGRALSPQATEGRRI